MAKIQRISNFQLFLPLFLSEDLEKQYQLFLRSDLGKIYQAIPWKKLAKSLKLQDKKKGPTSIFPPEGKVVVTLKSVSHQFILSQN